MLVRNFITLVYIFNIHTDEDLSYELSCKISVLASLCLAWKLKLSEMPPLPGKTWGVSVEELHAATCTFPGMDAIVTEEENMDDVDSENEEDNMPIDDELLDVAEEFALADEYHHQFESDVGEEYVWGQQWENDVLDVELQSSPSKRIRQ